MKNYMSFAKTFLKSKPCMYQKDSFMQIKLNLPFRVQTNKVGVSTSSPFVSTPTELGSRAKVRSGGGSGLSTGGAEGRWRDLRRRGSQAAAASPLEVLAGGGISSRGLRCGGRISRGLGAGRRWDLSLRSEQRQDLGQEERVPGTGRRASCELMSNRVRS